jgi:hypothetical protein
MSEALPRTVRFDETGEERAVVRSCKVCRVDDDDLRQYGFVCSPSGTAHHTSMWDETRTICGKDATVDRWWWPL